MTTRAFACLETLKVLAVDVAKSNPVHYRILKSEHIPAKRKFEFLSLLDEIEIHYLNKDKLVDLVDFVEGLSTPAWLVLKQQLRSGGLASEGIAGIPMSPLAKFRRILNKVARYEVKMNRKVEQKIAALPANATADDAALLRRIYAGKTKFFKETQMACKKPRAARSFDRATQIFSRYSIPLGIVSPAFMYPIVNSAREKDGKWWGQYGYDLTFIAVQNYGFYAFVLPWMMKRNMDLVSSTLVSFGYYNAMNYLSIEAIYNPLFGIDEEEAREFFNSIETQEFQEEFRRLVMESQNEELVTSLVGEMTSKEITYPELAAYLESEAFTENVSKEIFEDETLQDLLFEVIIEDIYNKQNGQLFDSGGDVGEDKFKAEFLVDAVSTPIDVLASVMIMNMVCNGMTQPHGMLKALGAYFGWSLTYNAGLFGFRLFGSGF